MNSMMTAVVTGSTSGIGKAVADMLEARGMTVIRADRSVADLRDIDSITRAYGEIAKTHRPAILVNAAGCAYYGLHENITPKQIKEMCDVNLTSPLIITNLLLPSIREQKGFIINISSVSAVNVNTHGAAYGATKAGLDSFGRSLWAEVRKHGVRVVNIRPDMTRTELYRNADFEASSEQGEALDPEDVAKAVSSILDMKEGTVITEITITPQKMRIHRKHPNT
ncbi:Short-chain dehydrogenase [Ruminococcaceae bacterium YRB3002]|nr:Short-chain dehydrogenase [Ruminococcaceae bacterium YRB3002]